MAADHAQTPRWAHFSEISRSVFAESNMEMSFAGRLLHWMLVFVQWRYLCRDLLQLIPVLPGRLRIRWQARKEQGLEAEGAMGGGPFLFFTIIVEQWP